MALPRAQTALPRFQGSFTQQEPIPDAGVEAATQVMQSGRLHRYNGLAGELSPAAQLEREYANWQGAPYCLAVASGGQAMQIALGAAGVKPGDKVLTNAFTLAPVPGAIAGVGAQPVLVEITEDLVIDFADLAAKAHASGAKVLLLSNMRGHMCDMDQLTALVDTLGLVLIEDCAHTMGARWGKRRSGNFGLAGCFSTQTYKHMNSGEGGLITSSDADFMARATLLSGSYMLFDRHGAGPDISAYEAAKYAMPNMSARMDNVRAAMLLPQLAGLEEAIGRWNERYDVIERVLCELAMIRLPKRPKAAFLVGSSVQFCLPGLPQAGARAFLRNMDQRGVALKWFGENEPVAFTSAHSSWRYVPAHDLPQTDAVLAGLFDMRLPLTFSLTDCALIAHHVVQAVQEVMADA